MKFDLEDALLLVGVASIVAGVALWSVPAALMVFGLFCLAAVWFMSRYRGAPAQEKGRA